MSKIREIEIMSANDKDSLTREIDAQKNLVNLYKKYFDETTLKLEDKVCYFEP